MAGTENDSSVKDSGNQEREDDPDDYAEMLEGVLQYPQIPWSNVAGLTDEKKKIVECIILPDKFPEHFKGKELPDYGAWLLYGAPGTGKTCLAEAIGSELCNSKFLCVSASDMASKWLSPEGKLTTELFKYAKQNKPCIIFIDDIDLLCNITYESRMAETVKAELLVHLDEAREEKIQVLTASAIPWMIDEAVRKRFYKSVYIPLPGLQAREEMIKQNLSYSQHMLTDEDIKLIASKTDGFSGADLSCIVGDALMEPVRKLQKATHFCKTRGNPTNDPEVVVDDLMTPCSPDTPGAIETSVFDIQQDKIHGPKVTLDDVLLALDKSKPSITEQDIQRHMDFKKLVEEQ